VLAPEDWHDPLASAYRRWGHLKARVDPLARIEPLVHPDVVELGAGADPARLEHFERVYCGSIGAEFMHIESRERAQWLAVRLEADDPPVDFERALDRLMRAELLEQFLHRRYVGSKRYSLEGAMGLIPLLDILLDRSADQGAQVALLGMSHRGRLTVMVNVVGVPLASLFAGLEDVDPRSALGSGDVKYHQGATGSHRLSDGRELRIHLASNPSHLEAVNPVLMGRVRARQTRLGSDGRRKVVPICLHGDAAFAGQGITAETLNLAHLPGYRVGGSIQVIVNNLIGFTAEPRALHSSRYATDVAKRLSIPILHVDAEDLQGLARAARIAAEYRFLFESDVVIDLIGYRRYGHSEVEDPTTTSPLLYQKVQDRPLLWESWARERGMDPESLRDKAETLRKEMSEAQDRGRAELKRPVLRRMPAYWDPYVGGQYDPDTEVQTSVPRARLEEAIAGLSSVPRGFRVHPKLERLFDQRQRMLRGEVDVDFGNAESLAFATLLMEGRVVRLSGQDSRRGTFNHRNAALFDVQSGEEHVPLAALAKAPGKLEIVDSPLSEAAILGYEYGFSRDYPDALVLWEAQFGDFANGAQIIIDQFIAAGEDKWGLLSGIVLLLPHGYEGQGPEHSSARIERFLQLASEHNLQICQPSTAAQYFHLLRRQTLRHWRKPLVVFMPKGLLRARTASSPLSELCEGHFDRLSADPGLEAVDRILVCSGKIVHELRAERERRRDSRTAILCLNQLYPFPEQEVHAELQRLGRARKVVWVQEEPANMGALSYVRPELNRLAGGRHVTTVKRSASASPATGSVKAHQLEQQSLIRLAFA
jgi:2-oxoglutarate dehydrogenase E1 component